MPVDLKKRTAEYWNRRACGTGVTQEDRFSRGYFDEIEGYRYRVEPEIFSFAQFTRYHGKRVLEVGVGAGTDFLQWVRAGAEAYGVDLTEEAVEHVRRRLAVYGLSAREVRRADAEALPYPDDSFDVAYSWGVIHHTPDTRKALAELIRCTVPGGRIKLMLYNRRSYSTFYKYLFFGLLRGRPFRSFADVLYHHQENLGTKGFTAAEVRRMVAGQPVEVIAISSPVTAYDLLWDRPLPFRLAARWLVHLFGRHRFGWELLIELEKLNEPASSRSSRSAARGKPRATGSG
jgi:ubiquinone/menaquinone biosynthesis C-methylase UbiE